MREGQRGLCYVRGVYDGEVVLTSYGNASGFCVDPIEKKPLNHFLPGTPVLSFGQFGCNLTCSFCQNYSISKAVRDDPSQHGLSALRGESGFIEPETAHRNIGGAQTAHRKIELNQGDETHHISHTENAQHTGYGEKINENSEIDTCQSCQKFAVMQSPQFVSKALTLDRPSLAPLEFTPGVRPARLDHTRKAIIRRPFLLFRLAGD